MGQKIPSIAILGASFGGLEVLLQLRRLLAPAAAEIVLIDRTARMPFWQAETAAKNVVARLNTSSARVHYLPRASFPHGVSIGRDVFVSSPISSGSLNCTLGRIGPWGRRQLGNWWARRYVA